jgi:energy-coupling factor transport system ATP-binding protein
LKSEGVTILMVSHDIEFCAAHADRCAMLFNGQITAEGTPETFFADLNFYTTVAARMTRGLAPSLITPQSVIDHYR